MDWDIIFFSEHFWIKSNEANSQDFFDIILDADLPVFVDPFLIFCSEKDEYKKLHESIIDYLSFLTHKSIWSVSNEEFKQYFYFKEVQETHIWYSLRWNPWRWLWKWFWNMLIRNLRSIFTNPNNNWHLEKLCLVTEKVWRDKISDFTINLIKWYLAEYTSVIASKIQDVTKKQEFILRRAIFDSEREIWVDKKYVLPKYNWGYILLLPKDILTTWETFISKTDFYNRLYDLWLPSSIWNDQIRFQFSKIMGEDISKKEKIKQIRSLIASEPWIIEDYIKYKEENKKDASQESLKSLLDINSLIKPGKIEKFNTLIHDFSPQWCKNSFEEWMSLVTFFKDTIENKKMWEEFWIEKWIRVEEKTVQNFFKLTWRWSRYNITAEWNNWPWPVDFVVSMWANDITVIEFKLATNSKCLQEKQLDSYKKSHNTVSWILVIFCFDEKEVIKVKELISKKGLKNAFYIDVTPQKSASNL